MVDVYAQQGSIITPENPRWGNRIYCYHCLFDDTDYHEIAAAATVNEVWVWGLHCIPASATDAYITYVSVGAAASEVPLLSGQVAVTATGGFIKDYPFNGIRPYVGCGLNTRVSIKTTVASKNCYVFYSIATELTAP